LPLYCQSVSFDISAHPAGELDNRALHHLDLQQPREPRRLLGSRCGRGEDPNNLEREPLLVDRPKGQLALTESGPIPLDRPSMAAGT
jgi:hypothetical protein